VLSDVLSAVRLRGAVYFDVQAAAPWVSMNPSMTDVGAAVMPGGESVIPFHVLTHGRAWVWLADRSLPVRPLEAGDVVMFPAGQSHVMASDPDPGDLPTVDLHFYRDAARSDEPFRLVQLGGRGEPASFVCGYLSCDAKPFNPLLAALPPMLVSRPPSQGIDLIQNLIHFAVEETASSRTGTEMILAKLSELMFVQAVRAHIETLNDGSPGWLSGLKSDQVGQAMRLIHAQPAKDWTLTSLAAAVALSRSKLAADFRRYTGDSPMRYLARWRIQLASRLLAETAASIAQAAQHVGYRSEAAFKRAFRRHAGVPAGQWRRMRKASNEVPA
jgi:AraC-like DNA-binding protein